MGTSGTGSTDTTGTASGSGTSSSGGRRHHRTHHASSKHHRMPKTGSDMPLAGLLGALALAGALGLRSAR
jgi:LPXTG-motif cell wall-anchored protein